MTEVEKKQLQITACKVRMGIIEASRIKSGKPRKPINWKVVGKVTYGTVSALVLGAGMCLIMVWNLMLPGILVGIVGIVMLLCLIPMCIGLK